MPLLRLVRVHPLRVWMGSAVDEQVAPCYKTVSGQRDIIREVTFHAWPQGEAKLTSHKHNTAEGWEFKTNKAVSASKMMPFLIFSFHPVLGRCLALAHMNEKQHKHMLSSVSTWRGSKAGERREMRWGLLLFIPNVKTEQRGLWQKYHIMSSVTVLLRILLCYV